MSWSSTSLFGISKLAHHCPGPPSKEDPVLVPGATVVIMEHSDLSIANYDPLLSEECQCFLEFLQQPQLGDLEDTTHQIGRF